MLLDDEDIDKIDFKIKETFGDIEETRGRGMPGHQEDGPGLQIEAIGGGPML